MAFVCPGQRLGGDPSLPVPFVHVRARESLCPRLEDALPGQAASVDCPSRPVRIFTGVDHHGLRPLPPTEWLVEHEPTKHLSPAAFLVETDNVMAADQQTPREPQFVAHETNGLRHDERAQIAPSSIGNRPHTADGTDADSRFKDLNFALADPDMSDKGFAVPCHHAPSAWRVREPKDFAVIDQLSGRFVCPPFALGEVIDGPYENPGTHFMRANGSASV